MRRVLPLILLLIGPVLLAVADESESIRETQRLRERIELLQARLDETRARSTREISRLREEKKRLQVALARQEERNRTLFRNSVRAAENLAALASSTRSPQTRLTLARVLTSLQDPRGLHLLLELTDDPRVSSAARRELNHFLQFDNRRFGPRETFRRWAQRIEPTTTWEQAHRLAHPPKAPNRSGH